tara:strand:+ start:88 stop:399 length:312 start_codon:yes stop_codon:yes gene_type:complete
MKNKIKKKNLKCATLEKKNGEKYTTCYDAKKAKKAKPKKRRRSTPYLPNDDTDDEDLYIYELKSYLKPYRESRKNFGADDPLRKSGVKDSGVFFGFYNEYNSV